MSNTNNRGTDGFNNSKENKWFASLDSLLVGPCCPWDVQSRGQRILGRGHHTKEQSQDCVASALHGYLKRSFTAQHLPWSLRIPLQPLAAPLATHHQHCSLLPSRAHGGHINLCEG